MKKIYWLLSESRSSVITKPQLRKSCQFRLDLTLEDREVDLIFCALDPLRTGVIKARDLVRTLMQHTTVRGLSLNVGASSGESHAQTLRVTGNEAARISYDNQYLNLTPPDPAECRLYSVWDLENVIRDKITEQSSQANNKAKTARKLFGNGGHHAGDLSISMDQLRFTFWKRFRLDVSDADLQRFFAKYQQKQKQQQQQKGEQGVIMLSVLMDGLFKESEGVATSPLQEDNSLNKQLQAELSLHIEQNNSLEAFFQSLRYGSFCTFDNKVCTYKHHTPFIPQAADQ